MTWTDEGQDNRVHKDAVETIEKVIRSAKTILADEFAIQQMEYDELYGVNSKEYIAYQNLVTNYLNHRGLLADLDAGKLMAPGTGTPKPPAPVTVAPAPLPPSSDPGLPVPAAPVGFPAQSMAMFDQQVEGFNDSIFESVGARSSLEFNPNATPPPAEQRVSELPIPPDAEPPGHLSPSPGTDYDPEFLPLEASIQVDEQVANAAAMIASAEPDPSYASGSWSIPSQIQAPLPPAPTAQPAAGQDTDPYASGSWAALSQSGPQPLESPGHVQQFAQPQLQPSAPSPWAPITPSPVEQSTPVPSPFQAPAVPAPTATPEADYNPWNPLPGSSQPAPSVEAFASTPPLPPQQQSAYVTDANNDKWETGGWATITPQQTTPSNGVGGGAGSGGTGSAFAAPPTVDPASHWAPPESHYQAQQYQTRTEDEEKEDDKSAFTFDPTKAWE